MKVPMSETYDPVKKHWTRLLKAVDDSYTNGFAFVGIYLQPGKEVELSDLRPDDDFPDTPIVLEHLTTTSADGRTRIAARLWECDIASQTWSVVATGQGLQWAKTLIAVALKLLPRGKNENVSGEKQEKKKSGGAAIPWNIWSKVKSHLDQECVGLSQREKLDVYELAAEDMQRLVNICKTNLYGSYDPPAEDVAEEEPF